MPTMLEETLCAVCKKEHFHPSVAEENRVCNNE